MLRSIRLALTPLLLLAGGLWAAPGWAQNQTTPGMQPGTTQTGAVGLAVADFRVEIWRTTPDAQILTRQTLFDTLNKANCECRTPLKVRVTPTSAGAQKVNRATGTSTSGTLAVYAAPNANCTSADLNTRNSSGCNNKSPENNPIFLGQIPISQLSGGAYKEFDTDVNKLFRAGAAGSGAPPSAADACQQTRRVNLYLVIDETNDDTPDTGSGQATGSQAGMLDLPPLDAEGPATPTGVTVEPGDKALTVKWNPNQAGGSGDLQGYVVLCARDGDKAVFPPGTFTNYVRSSATLCPGMSDSRSDKFASVDPAYLCSGLKMGATTNERITGLQNGIIYKIGVSAIDKNGNASAVAQAIYAAPIPTRDFYREYREANGAAEGGYCAAGGRRGPRAVELVATAVVALGLMLRRRATRRGR